MTLFPSAGPAHENAVAATVHQGEHLTAVGLRSGYLVIYHGNTLVGCFQSGLISKAVWVGDTTLICARDDTVLRYVRCAQPEGAHDTDNSSEAYPKQSGIHFEARASTRTPGAIAGIDYSLHGLAVVTTAGLLFFCTNHAALELKRPLTFCPALCASEVEGRQQAQQPHAPQTGVLAGGVSSIAWSAVGCQLAVCCPQSSMLVVLYLATRTREGEEDPALAPAAQQQPTRPLSDFKIVQASYLRCGAEGSLRSFEFYPGSTPSGNAIATIGFDGAIRVWGESSVDHHYLLVHGVSRAPGTVVSWLADQSTALVPGVNGAPPGEEPPGAPFGMNGVHHIHVSHCTPPLPDVSRLLSGALFSSPAEPCLVMKLGGAIDVMRLHGLCALPRRGVTSSVHTVQGGGGGTPAASAELVGDPESERLLCCRVGLSAAGHASLSFVSATDSDASLHTGEGRAAAYARANGGSIKGMELHASRDLLCVTRGDMQSIEFWSAGDTGAPALSSASVAAHPTPASTLLCSFDLHGYVSGCVRKNAQIHRSASRVKVKFTIGSLKVAWHPEAPVLYCVTKILLAAKGLSGEGSPVERADRDIMFAVELRQATSGVGFGVPVECPQVVPPFPGAYTAAVSAVFLPPAEGEQGGVDLLSLFDVSKRGPVVYPTPVAAVADPAAEHAARVALRQKEREEAKAKEQAELTGGFGGGLRPGIGLGAGAPAAAAPASAGKQAAMDKYAHLLAKKKAAQQGADTPDTPDVPAAQPAPSPEAPPQDEPVDAKAALRAKYAHLIAAKKAAQQGSTGEDATEPTPAEAAPPQDTTPAPPAATAAPAEEADPATRKQWAREAHAAARTVVSLQVVPVPLGGASAVLLCCHADGGVAAYTLTPAGEADPLCCIPLFAPAATATTATTAARLPHLARFFAATPCPGDAGIILLAYGVRVSGGRSSAAAATPATSVLLAANTNSPTPAVTATRLGTAAIGVGSAVTATTPTDTAAAAAPHSQALEELIALPHETGFLRAVSSSHGEGGQGGAAGGVETVTLSLQRIALNPAVSNSGGLCLQVGDSSAPVALPMSKVVCPALHRIDAGAAGEGPEEGPREIHSEEIVELSEYRRVRIASFGDGDGASSVGSGGQPFGGARFFAVLSRVATTGGGDDRADPPASAGRSELASQARGASFASTPTAGGGRRGGARWAQQQQLSPLLREGSRVFRGSVARSGAGARQQRGVSQWHQVSFYNALLQRFTAAREAGGFAVARELTDVGRFEARPVPGGQHHGHHNLNHHAAPSHAPTGVFTGGVTSGRRMLAARKGFFHTVAPMERRHGGEAAVPAPAVLPGCHPDVVSFFLESPRDSSRASLALFMLQASIRRALALPARRTLATPSGVPCIDSSINPTGCIDAISSSIVPAEALILYDDEFLMTFKEALVVTESSEVGSSSLKGTTYEQMVGVVGAEAERAERDLSSGAAEGVPHRSLEEGFGCDTEDIADLLSKAQLPGMPQSQSMQLLSLIGIEKTRAADGEAFDEGALRVIHEIRRNKPSGPGKPVPKLSWPAVLWAAHSDCTDALLDVIVNKIYVGPKQFTFETFLSLRIPLWLKSNAALRDLCEKMANSQFQAKKDPREAALLYTALGKRNVLVALFKLVAEKRLSDFFNRDFSEDKHKQAASKNALASLSKGNFLFGAAFFILAGRCEDAAQIVLERLGDWVVSYTILRLVDGSPLVGPLLKAFLTKLKGKVDIMRSDALQSPTPADAEGADAGTADASDINRITSKGDPFVPFLSHFCDWKLGFYRESFGWIRTVRAAVYPRICELLDRITSLPQLKVSAGVVFPASRRSAALFDVVRLHLHHGRAVLAKHYYKALQEACDQNMQDRTSGALRDARRKEKALLAQQKAVETGEMTFDGGIFGGMGAAPAAPAAGGSTEEEEDDDDEGFHDVGVLHEPSLDSLRFDLAVTLLRSSLMTLSAYLSQRLPHDLFSLPDTADAASAFSQDFVEQKYLPALHSFAKYTRKLLHETHLLPEPTEDHTEDHTARCRGFLGRVAAAVPRDAPNSLAHAILHHAAANNGFGAWGKGCACTTLDVPPSLEQTLQAAAGEVGTLALTGGAGASHSLGCRELCCVAVITSGCATPAWALPLWAATASILAEGWKGRNMGLLAAALGSLQRFAGGAASLPHRGGAFAESSTSSRAGAPTPHAQPGYAEVVPLFIKFLAETLRHREKVEDRCISDWSDARDELMYADAEEKTPQLSGTDRAGLQRLRGWMSLLLLLHLRNLVFGVEAHRGAAAPGGGAPHRPAPSSQALLASTLAAAERIFVVQMHGTVAHAPHSLGVAHLCGAAGVAGRDPHTAPAHSDAWASSSLIRCGSSEVPGVLPHQNPQQQQQQQQQPRWSLAKILGDEAYHIAKLDAILAALFVAPPEGGAAAAPKGAAPPVSPPPAATAKVGGLRAKWKGEAKAAAAPPPPADAHPEGRATPPPPGSCGGACAVAAHAARAVADSLFSSSWVYALKQMVPHNRALLEIVEAVAAARSSPDAGEANATHPHHTLLFDEACVRDFTRPACGAPPAAPSVRDIFTPVPEELSPAPYLPATTSGDSLPHGGSSPPPPAAGGGGGGGGGGGLVWNPFLLATSATSPRSHDSTEGNLAEPTLADIFTSNELPCPSAAQTVDLFRAKKGVVYSFCCGVASRNLVVSHQKGLTEMGLRNYGRQDGPVVFNGAGVSKKSGGITASLHPFGMSRSTGEEVTDVYRETDASISASSLQSVNFVPIRDDEVKKVLCPHPTHPLYAAAGAEGVSLFGCGGAAPVRSFKGSSSLKDCTINKVGFSHNGSLLAAADLRGDVNIWRVEAESLSTSSLVVQAQPHKETTSDLLFLDEGSIMATVGGTKNSQHNMLIHDLLYLRKGSHPGVGSAALPVDMKATCMVHISARHDILICGKRGEVCLFDLRNMRFPVYHSRIHDRSIYSVAVHPDHDLCALGTSDGDIMLLHPSKGLKPFYTYEGAHPRSKMNFSFESSTTKMGVSCLQYVGDYLISSGSDGRVTRRPLKTSA